MAELVNPITTHRLQLDATRAKLLHDLFVSPGYLLLKEVVAARCAELQIDAVNKQLYPASEMATEIAKDNLAKARDLNGMLQTLDDLEVDEARWYLVTIERRM